MAIQISRLRRIFLQEEKHSALDINAIIQGPAGKHATGPVKPGRVIKLIDILNEAKQIGSLYHSTSGENLISILKSNTLRADQTPNYAMTYLGRVSFTRDKNYRPGEYTMEIDGNKLSNNYKITPFAYMHGERGEAEEVVEETITDIKKYIINIYANIEAVEHESYKEFEQVLRLYPSLKFTTGGEIYIEGEPQRSGPVTEIPKAEALNYIKYNKY